MNFCSACGESVVYKVPEDDTRERAVCSSCGTIHYQNPKVIAGTLPIWGDQVLLCKRAIEPRRGYWTLPAGFLENGETAETGGARETMEEANATVENPSSTRCLACRTSRRSTCFSRQIWLDRTFSSGSESLEVELFSETDIPWDELAFPVISKTLKHYFADRAAKTFPVHYENLEFRRR